MVATGIPWYWRDLRKSEPDILSGDYAGQSFIYRTE